MAEVARIMQRIWTSSPTLDAHPERRQAVDALESAIWDVTAELWRAYQQTWSDPEASAPHERRYPALSALRQASNRLIDHITTTQVERGMVVWHLYNMGFVVHVPGACVGIDLLGPGLERLSDALDVLLISHHHDDHNHPALIDAMLTKGKPVLSNHLDQGIRCQGPMTWEELPGARVRVDIGDHKLHDPAQVGNMLMFHVDAGEHGRFYQTGDNANVDRLPQGRPCDAWAFHVHVGLDAPAALTKINPKVAIGGHIWEMGHPVGQYRWPHDVAVEALSTFPAERSIVPVWGDRYEFNGARLVPNPPEAPGV